MILQSLVQYYEALEKKGEITPQGWCSAKVSYALELSEMGELRRVLPLKLEVQKGKKTVLEPQLLKVPQMITKTSGVAANFLCDNSSYFLGIDNKGKSERAKECFQCAKEKHLAILEGIESKEGRVLCQYFRTWNPDTAKENPVLSEILDEVTSGGNLIFWVNGHYVQETEDIIAAWERYQEKEQNGASGICLVTGQKAEIARIHGTIKGVPGAQTSGAALISFNAPAFESYGKEQSFNAPVGTYAVYAYTTALNYLLADRKHASAVGDTMVVYWSEDGEEVYPNVFSDVTEPSADNYETVDGVFKNLASGKAINIPSAAQSISMDERFYILGLAPNAARLAVRFFYQDSFGNILKNIKKHYDQMGIVRPKNDATVYMGIWRMLMETVNKKSKDKKPASNMAGAVYRAVISGTRYPNALYQAVLGRIRAEQDDKDKGNYKVTRGRAAIIKAFLLRNGNYGEEEITMALNENSENVAYILGREFAVLEKIQMEANNEINATIKDRYFNAACASPASIFPILFKLKNSHIRKMSSKGSEVYYEKMLGELQNKILVQNEKDIAYPRRLSLEEQGMFILGYYHQNQKLYEKRKKEEK